MSRRKAREMALQALFLLDYNDLAVPQALDTVFAEHDDAGAKARDYTAALVTGTKQCQKEIDQMVSGLSHEWKLDRMAGVDRNLARIAIFEMRFSAEPIPAGVVINEAVELAKLFGTDESSRFLNGILGSLAKGEKDDGALPGD